MRDLIRHRDRAGETDEHARRHAGFIELERRTRMHLRRRELFDAASEILADALGADLVEIAELEGDVLVVRSCVGYRGDVRDRLSMSAARTPAGLAISTGEVVTVENVPDDDRFDPPEPLLSSGARSSLAVAIPALAHFHGGVTTHYRKAREFSAEERSFLRAFAGIIGLWLGARDPELRDSGSDQADFLAVVAHDLRNPLAAVEGSMDLLVPHRDTEADAEAVRERVMRIAPIVRRNVARMQSLIDDLLDLDALQRGGVTLHVEDCAASEILQDACDLMRDLVSARGIELVVHDPPAGLRVCCDRSRVLEVFSNLIGNAVKFTPPRGLIQLRALDAGDGTLLEVRDTGRGIPSAHLQRVFDRYQRASSGRGGVGLGLTIAKAIVEAHGGSISVESQEGVGSAFRFVLPRQRYPSGRFTLARIADA